MAEAFLNKLSDDVDKTLTNLRNWRKKSESLLAQKPARESVQSEQKSDQRKLSKKEKKAAKAEKYRLKQAKQQQQQAGQKKSNEKAKKSIFGAVKQKDRNSQSADSKKESLTKPLADSYDPQEVECHWDQWWENQGFYTPEENSNKEKFVMMIPPPNVTGSLHCGHAMMCAIEDCITRYWRMKGKNCLWLPGTDHAGIATQAVVERVLAKDGITRHDLGREKFLEKVWEWKNVHGGKICNQIRILGCSVDWSREVFTMDAKLNKAVTEAFVRMYQKGIIYREKRLCNWSAALSSAISDAEVDKMEIEEKPIKLKVPGWDRPVEFGVLHEFAYKVKGKKDEIVVATTRLETMLGDTGVAVDPTDERYKHLHGCFVEHPFIPDRVMPIVCDTSGHVKKEFGTGAVKMTPAHDHEDYKIGKAHDLEFINILTESGHINENGGKFAGQHRWEARETIEAEMRKLGIYKGKKFNKMVLPICSRSKDVIEPMVIPQWWVNCEEMAKRSLETVANKTLTIRPDTGKRTFCEYLEEIRPWCISRQLWWGHRIPAYQIRLNGELLDGELAENWVAGRNMDEAMVEARKKYPGGNIELEQDEDVLDTWFSSGLFPFSTMGWPDQTSDLKQFFPGSLLQTGGDIIFFWVARMVMMSLELMDTLPFTDVFLHPLVCDKYGKKMSKSKGNVIDPLHVVNGCTLDTLIGELHKGNLKPEEVEMYEVEKQKDFLNGIPGCGADALRFGLLDYLQQERSVNLDVDRVVGWRKFGNKLWQAHRLVLEKTPQDWKPRFAPEQLGKMASRPIDKWILNKLNEMVATCDKSLASYEFSVATRAFDVFFRSQFCDVYLEAVKPVWPREGEGDKHLQELVRHILNHCLETCYRALHPMMPFVTEELWQRCSGTDAKACIVAPYPMPVDSFNVTAHDDDIEEVFRIVAAIRAAKVAMNLKPSERPATFLLIKRNWSDEPQGFLNLIATLAKVASCTLVKDGDNRLKSCIKGVVSAEASVFLDVQNIDFSAQIKSIKKKIVKKEQEVEKLKKKLGNPNFLKLEQIPGKKTVVEKERQKLADREKELIELKASSILSMGKYY